MVLVLAFNPSTERQRQVDLCEFKASLESQEVRIVTQRNPVSKNKQTNKKTNCLRLRRWKKQSVPMLA